MRGELLADRYRLNEPLGSGSMGRVWQAWDTMLDRAVAIKLLAAAEGDPAAAQRFTDEAHAVARLTDPRIAALYDFGHAADGRPFLVMELVPGRSLAQLLRDQGPLDPHTAADLGGQAARALAAAHEGGVVHHDVKPANLLVTEKGQLKLVDFGVASLADGAGRPGAENTVLGTVAYVAPERALGHPTDPAADLYALGCVLYELLTGAPPFRAGTAADVVRKHLHEQPRALGAVRPEVPHELQGIVHALLAKKPVDRPADANLVAERFEALAAPAAPPAADSTQPLPRIKPEQSPDPGPEQQPRDRSFRRGGRLLVAVCALTAVVAGALLGFSGTGGDGGGEGTGVPSVPSASRPAQSRAPSSSPPAASPTPVADGPRDPSTPSGPARPTRTAPSSPEEATPSQQVTESSPPTRARPTRKGPTRPGPVRGGGRPRP